MDSSCFSLMCTYKNRAQQLQINKIFSFPVPHSDLSPQNKINYKYIEVTYDQTKAVAILDLQYRACWHANRQFCRKNAPFQPLTNLPSCVTALYNQAIKEQCSLVIFHMPCTFVPIVVASNLWIISSTPQTLGSTMTIICSDKANRTIPLQQPFHILRLSPACSTRSR